jgi:hypothetical protein
MAAWTTASRTPSLGVEKCPRNRGNFIFIFIFKHPSFLAVNTMLGNIKTALAVTYHAFGFEKYAHRYLSQVQYLFNR